MFIVIQTDSGVTCMNDGRPEIGQMSADDLRVHIRSYVSECCTTAVEEALAWVESAKVGEWLDAEHLDDEIYVRV